MTRPAALRSRAAAGPPARGGRPREQAPARVPDETGYAERDGVSIYWERHGTDGPSVLLLPTWSIVHSRCWKMQIPYLARHARVLTFDGRGNGRSERPSGPEAYAVDQFTADALAVLDASDTPSAALVALSCGALWATALAADHAGRVEAIAYIAPAVALAPSHPERERFAFDEPLDTSEGWAKYNSHYWTRDYEDFLAFFFAKCFNEPHSSKQIEDCVGWALDTSPQTLADTTRGIGFGGPEPFFERCARVGCPTIVLHGDEDLVRPHAQGAALAEATAGRMVTLAGCGHIPSARDPVRVNMVLRDFLLDTEREVRWPRARSRRRRALYISSPIGLGHVRRDLAIAAELRRLHPDLEIDWLAQPPVTAVLQSRGERIHPAGRELANESAHITRESRRHELNCFEALRRMDEILLANFMIFTDVAREQHYDIWIGDEAWELDYYLHENPELKTAAYVWLTDFVGYIPMPEGGEREARLTADYNAEMIEQVERCPRVRDRAIFVGEPDDVVDRDFGPGLPGIRPWTEAHFDFSGYITDFDPAELLERDTLRAELGYRQDELVCVVAVGGSGIGTALLGRLAASFRQAREMVPNLHMILVTGPNIDPGALPRAEGLEVRPYVPDLHRHLAASDLAAVQGGLATTMELTAARRPFLYFPLKRHFEQQVHVRHRLDRHRAGVCLQFEDAAPERLATAIAEQVGREVLYEPVTGGGAARAARLISELI